MELKVKKLSTTATLPTYATPGAACFDLYADGIQQATAEEMEVLKKHGACIFVTLRAEHSAPAINTGLAFEVPEGHVMLVFSRSGHGFKNNVRLANCVGVIDSDYRGELMVKLTNDGGMPLSIYQGDRIAQAMIVPVPQVSFVEVDELSDTQRGAGGFGSTGA